jgi:hypothetical protein
MHRVFIPEEIFLRTAFTVVEVGKRVIAISNNPQLLKLLWYIVAFAVYLLIVVSKQMHFQIFSISLICICCTYVIGGENSIVLGQ